MVYKVCTSLKSLADKVIKPINVRTGRSPVSLEEDTAKNM